MSVSPPVLRVNVKDTSSVEFAGTTASTDNEKTKGVKVWAYDSFGVWIDISAESGTSPTMDLEFEYSEDSTNGVNGTWATYRAFQGNSSVAAQYKVPQITTTTGAHAVVDIPVHTSQNGYIRMNINLGGTSPTYDIDSFYWVFRNVSD